VELALNGELFLYLLPPPPCDSDEDEEVEDEEEEKVANNEVKPPEKHSVMLTTRKEIIPTEGIPITRIDRMLKPRNWSVTAARRRGAHNAIFLFGSGDSCSATSALYKIQAHLGMYAPSKYMLVTRLLLSFVSSADESCLRATLFYAWMTYVRQPDVRNTSGNHRKMKVSYNINLDAPVWAGKREVHDECLAELLYQNPLCLGYVVSDPHAEVRGRTPSERSRSRSRSKSSISRDGTGEEIHAFCRSLSRSLSGSQLTLTAPLEPPLAPHAERTGTSQSERPTRHNSRRNSNTSAASSRAASRPSSANSAACGLRVARGLYSVRAGVSRCGAGVSRCGAVGLPGSGAQRPPLRRPPSRQPMQHIQRMMPQPRGKPRSLSREPNGRPMFFDPYEVDFFYA